MRQSRGPDQRVVLSAFGPLEITRRHFGCPDCPESDYLADTILGVDGYLSPRVLRLACRLSGDGSFEVASQRLDELCGIQVSGETLRRHCPAVGAAMAQWIRKEPSAMSPFAEATGEVEVQTDAGKVNTTTGWRDLKVLAFTKRLLGKPASPEEWNSRNLPRPTARMVFTDIEEIEIFRQDWRKWADQLGIGSGAALTMLGDGAEWIWNAAEAQFPGCKQVLDVYHALEHVGTAAKKMYGEGTEEATTSFESGKAKLLAEGWKGISAYVGDELCREDTPVRRAALEELIGYASNQVGRMCYRARLEEGRSIGSGLIEGQVKTLGLRLKARGARWLERNAENMATLVGLSHSTLWETYWALKA
jgi:hypothetical protein